MKKPEKKKILIQRDTFERMEHFRSQGYNQACDDWEKWHESQCELCITYDHIPPPSEEEIDQICKGFGVSEMLGQRYKLVKAIHKRIRGGSST